MDLDKIAREGAVKADLLDNDQTRAQERIDELNRHHALIPVGGKIAILNEGFDPVLGRPEITFSSAADFSLRYCNQHVLVNGNRCALGKYWLNHPRRREYRGIAFDPTSGSEGYFNLFRGFGLQPRKGHCSRFKDHMKHVLCGGDEELFRYLWNWVAHTFQRPAELPETAVVMRGSQGVGKNTFADTIGRLVGHHYLPLTSMAQVVGRFNSHLKDALVVHANEAVWGGDKRHEGALKAMITDELTPIEFKGKDIFVVRNYKRLIVSSNEDWAVPMDLDDRRFLVLDVSDRHKEDHAYFAAIREELNSGGYEALMHELVHTDLTDFNPRKLPSSTTGLDIKLRSADSATRWWFQCLLDGKIDPIGSGLGSEDTNPWTKEMVVPTQVIYDSYLRYCDDQRISRREDKASLVKKLKKLVTIGKPVRPRRAGKRSNGTPKRKRVYRIPPLTDCREMFEAKTKSSGFDWEGS